MNCPVCDNTRLREVEKDGILIDICPTCKGVWLDRGELEKLMQGVREVRQDYNEWYYGNSPETKRSPEPSYPANSPDYPHAANSRQRRDGDREDHDRYRDSDGHDKRKKKKSVLDVFGDLFD